MLVMAMKEQFLELRKSIEILLNKTEDAEKRAELEQKLKRVDWAIAEMDRKKMQMQEVEL